MNIIITEAKIEDANELADLRVLAMKPSLEAIGRFDPLRARSRFLEKFNANNTHNVYVDDRLVAFYVVQIKPSHLLLDHLYVSPVFQNQGLGSHLLQIVKDKALELNKPIKLGALKESKSNSFYQAHGFVQIGEEEFDNYYEFKHS